MNKKVILSVSIVVLLALACVVAFLSLDRAGGEIGFGAIVDRVEDGMAYATVTEQGAGFLPKKLPEKIMFSITELDVELKAGDIISACYLRGTIDGQTARVVSVSVINEQRWGKNAHRIVHKILVDYVNSIQ